MARVRPPQSFERPIVATQARSRAQELVDEGRAALARATTGPARRELAVALTRAESVVREGLRQRGLGGDERWSPAATESAMGLVLASLHGVAPQVQASLIANAMRARGLGARSVTDVMRLLDGPGARGLRTLTGRSRRVDAEALGRYQQLAQRAATRPLLAARAVLDQATARGTTGRDAVRALTGVQDRPGALRGTLGATETALRTEAMRSYAEGAQAEMEALQAERYPDLARKLIETFDQRTGRDSYAAHGQVRGPHEPFTDGRHTYLLPPGRPNDRAVVIPWRKAWENRQEILSATVSIDGAASNPTTLPWKPNVDGPRTLESALDFVRQRGVDIPDEVEFRIVEEADLPLHEFARYCQVQSSAGRVSLKSITNKYGKVMVRMKRSVLESDEAILAILGHEMHEVSALLEIFEHRPTIEGRELAMLISPQYGGTLHLEAWDIADQLVRKLREEKGSK